MNRTMGTDDSERRRRRERSQTVGYDEAVDSEGPFEAADDPDRAKRRRRFQTVAYEQDMDRLDEGAGEKAARKLRSQTVDYERDMDRLDEGGTAQVPAEPKAEPKPKPKAEPKPEPEPAASEPDGSEATTLERPLPGAKDADDIALADTELAPSEESDLGPSETMGRTRSAVLPSADPVEAPRPRYEERERLGEGGMGEVVLVRDHDIGRDVALKRLLPERNDPAYLESFAREVRTVGALEHPNIVPIHDVDVDEQGRYFFVMKRVEGETLEDIIERLLARDPATMKRYSFEARIDLFMGLLRALKYAHASGVLHRDIKPANVMVGPYGELMLMDWGIAARPEDLDDSTRDVLIGTPLYMSPEQARGENDTLDERSDLYSACVLFHELVTLRHYLGELEQTDEVIEAVAHRGWAWSMMDWHRPGPQPMPPMELFHFLNRGLKHDPADRWPSADAMLVELRRVLEGRVRIQCPLTLTKRVTRQLGRFVDRRPWLSFLLLATLLVGAVYGIIQAAQTVLG